jgi:isocitrate dehydrogenase
MGTRADQYPASVEPFEAFSLFGRKTLYSPKRGIGIGLKPKIGSPIGQGKRSLRLLIRSHFDGKPTFRPNVTSCMLVARGAARAIST